MISLDTNSKKSASIKVIGVGGGGGNAINSMIEKGLDGVDFIAANTDNQALEYNLAPTKIQIGKQLTKGLGAGADPEIGRSSIEENREQIKETLSGSDMVFITAGMGGGTGTGGTPEIAEIASEIDALTVAIVTKPFTWEGKKRMVVAEEWIEKLRSKVDALIIIPNQRLLEIIDKKTSFKEAFLKVDEVLYNATRGISDIISQHGVVNVDFADVKTIMKGMGDALMGIGIASGEDRAVEATKIALNSPLLDGVSIQGAKGVLVNITGGADMSMFEIAEAVSIVEEATGGDANIIHGVVYKEELENELMVTVVATGFNTGRIVETQNNKITEKKSEKKESFETENQENVYFNAKNFDRSPKGQNQLAKFDTPSILRNEVTSKTQSIARQLSPITTSEDYVNAREKITSDEKRRSNYEVSSHSPFIRKMFD